MRKSVATIADILRQTHRLIPVVLVLFALGLTALGFSKLYTEIPVITHFGDIVVQRNSDSLAAGLETVGLLNGQVESKVGGFVAGEKLSIFMTLYLRQKEWKNFRQLFEKPGDNALVLNSERIDDYDRDLRQLFHGGGLRSIVTTQGTIPVVQLDDEKRIAVFDGCVVFTKSGTLKFGDPLGLILETLMLDDFVMEIAPRHVMHQIQANRRSEAMSYFALAIAVLAVFVAVLKRS